jgi:hypothetical protein
MINKLPGLRFLLREFEEVQDLSKYQMVPFMRVD